MRRQSGRPRSDLPHLNGYRTKSVASKVGLPKGGDVTRLTLYEYATTVRPRYRRARKKEKGRILDEFCQTAGIHRKAAIRLLGRVADWLSWRRRGAGRHATGLG